MTSRFSDARISQTVRPTSDATLSRHANSPLTKKRVYHSRMSKGKSQICSEAAKPMGKARIIGTQCVWRYSIINGRAVASC